jgi:hypothetical protein
MVPSVSRIRGIRIAQHKTSHCSKKTTAHVEERRRRCYHCSLLGRSGKKRSNTVQLVICQYWYSCNCTSPRMKICPSNKDGVLFKKILLLTRWSKFAICGRNNNVPNHHLPYCLLTKLFAMMCMPELTRESHGDNFHERIWQFQLGKRTHKPNIPRL